MTDPVNNNSAPVWNARTLADNLDAADGKKDGKISASIWNNYLKTIGSTGNRINNYITVDNAERSLNYYKTTKDLNNTDAKWNNWNMDKKDYMPSVPSKDENPPAKTDPIEQAAPPEKSDPPANSTLDAIFNTKSEENAGKKVTNGDGTAYEYDNNGYIKSVYDNDGNETRYISRDADGSVEYYYDYEYDENGNNTREIMYSADGSVSSYYDSEYDEKGNNTRDITYSADGNVEHYIDYEYDENGNMTREIYRDKDGSVRTSYWDYVYDNNGKETRRICRKADGNVHGYLDTEYDNNGKQTRMIGRKADGSFNNVYYEDATLNEITVTEKGNYKISIKQEKTLEDVIKMLNITDERDKQALRAANPKAAQAGKFDENNSIYIPKQLAAKIQLEQTFDL